jgi:hypothetical protein
MVDLINENDGFIEYILKTDDLSQMQPIVQKKDFIFSRIQKHKYRVVTKIENNNIQIKKVVDFHIIQLIFEINKEFFEKIHLDVNASGDNAYLCLMLRNLFEKIGFKQQCLSLQLTKVEPNESTIVFVGNKDDITINSYIDAKKGNGFEIIPLEKFTIITQLHSNHVLELIMDIELAETNRKITYIVEKAFGMLLKHVFLKTKRFIEAIK